LDLVPRQRRKPYDVRKLIGHVVDKGSFFELLRRYATGLVTGLARLDGHVVGIYANDCRTYAGCLTADGSHKVRRFVELCETFHLPVIAFVDEPGFMIGEEAEKAATIRHGTSAVLTVAQANVPWASVVVRKSFGVASAAHYGADAYVLAWPSAELGALPVEGGVAVAYGREIAAAPDPEAKRRELEEELARRTVPESRAEAFAFHELIDPRETRAKLCQWLDWCGPRLEGLKGPSAMGYRP
jgi:acetyl-CoA carboxylase carboxyltransferase component